MRAWDCDNSKTEDPWDVKCKNVKNLNCCIKIQQTQINDNLRIRIRALSYFFPVQITYGICNIAYNSEGVLCGSWQTLI